MLRPAAGRTARLVSLAGVAALALTATACGRSSSNATGGAVGQPTSAASSSSAPSAGDFGDLKHICGPGNAKGATARGVTNSEIRIGTSGDPGAAAAPGLEQEFFDVADAFTKWCNAAGGINGRKIVLTKYDAKLFESAQQVVNACQTEFMLVGNGNAVDAPMQKPRVACHLGQIASYVVSPEAVDAAESISAQPANSRQYPIGGIRLLADAFPGSKSGIGIGSSTIASITPQGKRAKEASENLGYKVTDLQERPALVTNYRPYMEELKGSGTKGYNEIVAQDPGAEVQAMSNVGWKPDWVLWGTQFYGNKSVQAIKAIPDFPNSYVYLLQLPWDLIDQYPVLQEAKKILTAAVSNPDYTTFTSLAFNAWTLWAKSATECGSNLTESCVFEKAKANHSWTAGGLFPPRDVGGKQSISECFAMVKLTTDGWKYDKDVTKPNTDSVYNCDAKNVGKVQTYQ